MTSKYIGSRSSLPKIATFGPPRAEKLIFSDKTLACSNDSSPIHKNWNISGLLSGFQLEKLFFIHTVWSYSHSTGTAKFVTSIGLKKWDGFLTFLTEYTQEKAKYHPQQIWKCWNVRNTVDLRLLMTLQIRRWPLQIRRWQ